MYEHERESARASFFNVGWRASSFSHVDFECTACGFDLLEQVDANNTAQDSLRFRCRNCAAEPEREDVIESAVDKIYGGEAHERAKEGTGEGPMYQCPVCERHTYLENEDICANCGEALDFERECGRCSEIITIQEYLDGNDSGFCSYCNHVIEKVMRE